MYPRVYGQKLLTEQYFCVIDSSSKANNSIIPYELWSSCKPNVNFLRVFDSQITFLRKGSGDSKFDPKREKDILVGYSNEAKAYRL